MKIAFSVQDESTRERLIDMARRYLIDAESAKREYKTENAIISVAASLAAIASYMPAIADTCANMERNLDYIAKLANDKLEQEYSADLGGGIETGE